MLNREERESWRTGGGPLLHPVERNNGGWFWEACCALRTAARMRQVEREKEMEGEEEARRRSRRKMVGFLGGKKNLRKRGRGKTQKKKKK